MKQSHHIPHFALACAAICAAASIDHANAKDRGAANPYFEDLSEQPASKSVGDADVNAKSVIRCTADKRWCAELLTNADTIGFTMNLFDGRSRDDADSIRKNIASYTVSEDSGDSAYDRSSTEIWPQIIRQPVGDPVDEGTEPRETIIIGLLSGQSSMYSGGGAQVTTLNLYRVNGDPFTNAGLENVLNVPWNGSIMIRACFSEEDLTLRKGVCHDLYDFTAELTLAKSHNSPLLPQLIYQTKAVATPGTSRRSNDNSTGVQLTDKDILPQTDLRCSYRRLLTYNPTTQRYEFDRPGPDCSDYTMP
ncbi:hypothetical protein ACFOWX_09835 [Sphingorhabdus arenilitoris]|uniref:Uncharacterized protein n=1 Tax=Sphingorhabdus arenilitoris TaxID=1490041 RepID=A0ABV8RGZ2_9SPHN